MTEQQAQQQQNGEVRRIVPQSGLDWNMMLTDTMWGSQQISRQLHNQIKARTVRENGQIDKEAAWELLSFYTRDMRLANLNVLTGELDYCKYYLDLAGDMLREGFPESFATCLGRAATILELSQSKGGFLRRRQNTLTTENLQGEIEPQKRRLLFSGKKQG